VSSSGWRGGAQFDILVLDLGKDQANGGKTLLVAGFHGGNLRP
jgi:hypothetical protein